MQMRNNLAVDTTHQSADVFELDFRNGFFANIDVHEDISDVPAESLEKLDFEQQQQRMFADSTLVRSGEPAQISDYDGDEDAILFAYDPVLTPDPKIDLLQGDNGAKVLMLNDQPAVTFQNSPSLTISDINVFELALPA